MKTEAAVLKSVPECRDELAAKDATLENFDRKKRRRSVVLLQRCAIRQRVHPHRHHAMHMWVKFEFLTPGVQHAEEANFCAKMFGIAGHFEQCFCTGSEQEIVDELLILKSEWG